MKYCKRCVMPETRPGIHFNEDGVCQACVNYEERDEVDWNKRWEELKDICNEYRASDDNNYDCLIAVSGGKDSHFQTYVMKEKLNMNPLLVTVEDNFPMTEAGKHNLKNLSETFGCNIISLKPNIKNQKKISKYTFEEYGKPTWYIDRLIYTYPLHIALKFGIPLLIYGENVNYEYGGKQKEETPSAKNQIYNGVASKIPWEELYNLGIDENEMKLLKAPSKENLDSLNPIYLSYFVKWNSYKNYQISKKYGFKDLTHEWDRTHRAENFDQIDTRAYLVHNWMKYPKFGHQSATDYVSRFIRYGLIDREKGKQIVKKYDHNLDTKAIEDFINFVGYTRKEFWEIVDKFYNEDIFKKNEFGEWVLKDPIWKEKTD